jgi:hypothetical protein
MSTAKELAAKWKVIAPFLNERARRLWAASEVKSLDWGGLSLVSEVTGLSPNTIKVGIQALKNVRVATREPERQRRSGAGRKLLQETQPGLAQALERLVEPETRGDPMSPLRWTNKSTRQLSDELKRQGYESSANTVGTMLKAAGYSLQSLRKTREGSDHPDRDSQFRCIQRRVVAQQKAGQPVISVDCKKKELIGDFKNGGREWQKAGEPEAVRVHDFQDPKLGKAIPYGVYDIMRNEGWVSVGVDHETAEFAASTIGRWWRRMGIEQYPRARELLIVADGGGSNGSRNRAWKVELQELANHTGLTLHVSHLPPGTSKWNKIEHRMFCHITQNWRGRPLISREVVVNLIAATTTRTGLRIRAALDTKDYPTGREVSDDEIERINIERHRLHGNWNYTIRPLNNL